MTIYISHAYGGKEANKERIETIIKQLVKLYPSQTFISPVHCFGYMYNDVPYMQGLRMCLDLLDKCDAMWVFGDYHASKGVNAEIEHCEKTGKEYRIVKGFEY